MLPTAPGPVTRAAAEVFAKRRGRTDVDPVARSGDAARAGRWAVPGQSARELRTARDARPVLARADPWISKLDQLSATRPSTKRKTQMPTAWTDRPVAAMP